MKSVLLLSGMMACGLANAAEGVNAPSFQLGEVSVFPGLGLVVKKDSNIYRASAAAGALVPVVASNIAVLSPSVVFKADKEALNALLSYSADLGRYSADAANNFADQKLLAELDYEMTSRSNVKFSPSLVKGHDDKGSAFGAISPNPNQYTEMGANGSWLYGADEATVRTVLDLGYNARQYDNNRAVTNAYDKNIASVGGTVYARVMPNTSLLLQGKNTVINYKLASSVLDGNEQRLMVGVKWDATAQTAGEVKVGQLKKNYANAAQGDLSLGSWDGALRWSPLSFFNMDLITSRATVETTLANTRAILVSNSGLSVGYDINDRVTVSANGAQVKEAFVGVARTDNTNNFGFKAEYKVRSWLIGSAEYTNSAKTSNAANADFKRNIFAIGLRSTL